MTPIGFPRSAVRFMAEMGRVEHISSAPARESRRCRALPRTRVSRCEGGPAADDSDLSQCDQAEDALEAFPLGGRVLDAGGKLVTPGLIDLHCHVYPYGSGLG